MKKILALAAVVGLTVGFAQAAFQANWTTPVTTTDLQNDMQNGGSHEEIIAIHYGGVQTISAVNYYCFRMDVLSAPPSPGATSVYMLNFDLDQNQLTGGNPGTSYYVAQGLAGIDKIIDAHRDGFGTWITPVGHDHDYTGAGSPNFDVQAHAVVGVVFNEGAVGANYGFEWLVPLALLPQNQNVDLYGSSLTATDPNTTFDTTRVLTIVTVPEPTSMALLALGVAAIGLRRKFRA